MRHLAWFALGLFGLVGCSGAEPLEESELTDLSSSTAELEEDPCAPYNDFTAAIASRTIDCLGTIGPDVFSVDEKGNLRRSAKFLRCTTKDENAIGDIDRLLSLQQGRKDAPLAQRCISGRWQVWYKKFVNSGIRTCPTWKKTETINPVTFDSVKELGAAQPKLPDRGDQKPPALPHENYRFTVSYGKTITPTVCKTPANCARACAEGFAGFVLRAEKDQVLGDPSYWLLSRIYAESSNPFLLGNYYHPMSYSGVLPGALYGNYNRKDEPCSRYMSDGLHWMSKLVEECLVPGDSTTCLTVCADPTASN